MKYVKSIDTLPSKGRLHLPVRMLQHVRLSPVMSLPQRAGEHTDGWGKKKDFELSFRKSSLNNKNSAKLTRLPPIDVRSLTVKLSDATGAL